MQLADGGFSLHLQIADEGGPAVLAVQGEIDAANAETLELALLEVLKGDAPVVVDLGAVSFIDSSGLNAVVRVLRRHEGANVALAAANPAIARLIEMRGLHQMVAVHPSVESALTPSHSVALRPESVK